MLADEKTSCNAPWNLLRIENNGDCYSCSSAYVKNCYCFGNIFSQDAEEIWNGKAAIEFRKDKLNYKYEYCKINDCHKFAHNCTGYNVSTVYKEDIISPYPSVVSLSYDYTCSEKCIFCRDEIQILPKDVAIKWEAIIDTKIIPLLKNTNLFEITCCGELLTSEHSKNILKRVLTTYPNIKLRLFSNGINFTPSQIDALGIEKNIYELCISLHCCTRNTYKKIFRKDNFDKVYKNLQYIKNLKQKGDIKYFYIQFVINKLNYREIKPFIKLSQELGAVPSFTFVSNTTNVDFLKDEYNWAIYKENHYLYNDFVSVLQDNFVFQNIPDFLKSYKKISNFKIFKNFLYYILKNKRQLK